MTCNTCGQTYTNEAEIIIILETGECSGCDQSRADYYEEQKEKYYFETEL